MGMGKRIVEIRYYELAVYQIGLYCAQSRELVQTIHLARDCHSTLRTRAQSVVLGKF